MRPIVHGDRGRLVLASFLMLFVELALIRWTGSNVLYLSYFSNFVLLGSFLGIGLGFLRARARRDLSPFAPAALGLLVLFIAVFPVDVQTGGDELLFFEGLAPSGPPRELVLPLVFLAVAITLMFIAEGVARAFARFAALDAYTYDLAGSLLGVVAFTGLSFLRLPPVVWGSIAALGFAALLLPAPNWRRVVVVLVPTALLVGVLLVESLAPDTSWSPYYKIVAEEHDGNLRVDVNGVPHQVHWRLDQKGAELYEGLYDLVDDAFPRGDDVLIIGAGGGNDVAVALDRGARHVDAVEIDPRIQDLGASRHPEHPYQDPRVTVHIDDGRAFVERTDRRFDLILLALPDSITLVAGQSSLRLESYLFTREAVEAYRDLLVPGGVFAMYNYYRTSWLVDRYAGSLDAVFGPAPCVVEPGASYAWLAASDTEASITCPIDRWERGAATPSPATDDHPFPYLRTRSLPAFYALSLALILAVSLVVIRAGAGPLRRMAPYTDLFCMGAAFLLLETKYVVQFSLLFGTTWFVNAVVFAGVLLSVLAAVAVARRVTVRRPAVPYLVLFASLVVAFAVPLDALLDLAVVPRAIVAVVLAFFPIFTANVVFAERFKTTGDSTTAFGANLLGAMFGGVLEYAALLTGYRFLLVLVAVLYGLAFAFGRRHLVVR